MRNWRSDNLVTGIIHRWLSTRSLWRLCMKLEGVRWVYTSRSPARGMFRGSV